MKKIKEFIKIIILCLVLCVGTSVLYCNEVEAAKAKLSYADREDTENKVTLYVTGVERLNKDYTTTIYYDWYSSDGDDYESKEVEVKFKKDDEESYKYTFKLKKKGSYDIYVIYENENEYEETEYISIKYDDSKPKFSLNGEPQVIRGGNTYKTYYDFLGGPKKDGNTYYYKGVSAKVGVVVYCGSLDLSKIICKAGSNSVTNTNVKVGSGGFASTEFTFNGETDGTVSFEATNVNGLKSSISTGKTLVIDNTKPIVKIDSKYAVKNKTVYKNKSVSVPIEVTEKHFDSSNTKVLVDGRVVNVSWSSSGDKNTANVKLDKGEHVITITSTDKAGNVSDEAKSAKIIVDTTAPTVKVSGVANGKSYGNKGGEYTPYMISIKIEDKYLSKDQKVTLSRIDAKSKKVIESIQLTETYKDSTYQCVSTDIANDGYYKLTIAAKDKAKNSVTNKSLDKKGKYKVEKEKVVGYFYINRNGSKYVIDEISKEYFASAVKESGDVVIYEYNINSIKKENQAITLITTLGDRVLTLGNDYSWEDVSKQMADDTYQHVYKYTVKKENFGEGLYSIKIVSSAEVLGDGNNSLEVEASSDNIMNEIINIDTKAPEVISMEKRGSTIYLHIRDNNLDEESLVLKVSGKKVTLKLDEDMSTSTNYYYIATVAGSASGAELKCSDNAGNETISKQLQTDDEGISVVVIVIIIVGIAIFVIATTVVIIVLVKRKK